MIVRKTGTGALGNAALPYRQDRLVSDAHTEPEVTMVNQSDRLEYFARRHTEAWCSQDPAQVAAQYAAAGSLTINEGVPSVGPEAITEAARSFMVAFPDLQVLMDDVRPQGDNAVYRWTLVGTNTGPGGTGHPVRISGFEEWTFDEDGLIAASLGYFDQDEYNRQLGREAG